MFLCELFSNAGSMRKFNSMKTNRICQNAWEIPNNKLCKIINYNKINRIEIEIEFSFQSILIFLFWLWSGRCFDAHAHWVIEIQGKWPTTKQCRHKNYQPKHSQPQRTICYFFYLRIWFGILSASALICVCSFSSILWFFVSVCFSIFRHSLDNSGEDMSK